MKVSAGIALYRRSASGVEIFLVHFGGPFWAKKDERGWSFPKGEHGDEEDPLSAARREFREETGLVVEGEFRPLQPIKSGGKLIRLWAVEGDCDARAIRSGTFSMEWPPRSGLQQEFPEVDRAAWFSLEEARTKLVAGQVAFVDQIRAAIDHR